MSTLSASCLWRPSGFAKRAPKRLGREGRLVSQRAWNSSKQWEGWKRRFQWQLPKKVEGIHAYLNGRGCVEPRLRQWQCYSVPLLWKTWQFPTLYCSRELEQTLEFPPVLVAGSPLIFCEQSRLRSAEFILLARILRVVTSCICYLWAPLGFQGIPTAYCIWWITAPFRNITTNHFLRQLWM